MLEGANHLDQLYGKLADEIVTPLLMRIIEKVWGIGLTMVQVRDRLRRGKRLRLDLVKTYLLRR